MESERLKTSSRSLAFCDHQMMKTKTLISTKRDSEVPVRVRLSLSPSSPDPPPIISQLQQAAGKRDAGERKREEGKKKRTRRSSSSVGKRKRDGPFFIAVSDSVRCVCSHLQSPVLLSDRLLFGPLRVSEAKTRKRDSKRRWNQRKPSCKGGKDQIRSKCVWLGMTRPQHKHAL